MTDTERQPCLCCGRPTLAGEPPGTFMVCPVCGWVDDGFQAKHPDFADGTNAVSLNTARRNFKTFGAADPRRRAQTPPPPNAEEQDA